MAVCIRFLLLVLFLFFRQLLVLGQEPCYYNFNDRFGFKVKEVYEISQDSKRNIWIASLNGLYRYDGNEIVYFNSKEQSSGSLSILLEDSVGRIWTRNFRGQIYHTQGEQLVLAHNWEDSIGKFPSMVLDSDQNLWLTHDKAIYKYSIFNNTWKKITLDPTKYPHVQFDFSNTELVLTTNDVIWLSNNSGKLAYILNDTIHLLETQNSKSSNPLFYTDRLFEFMGNMYAITANSLVYKVNINGVELISNLSSFVFQRLSILDISTLHDSTLVVSTINGIYLLNKDFQQITNTPIYQGVKVSCVYPDAEGSVWISTLQQGIRVIPNMEVQIFNAKNSMLPQNEIFCLTKSDNNIYTGLNSGIVGFFNEKKQYNTIHRPNYSFEVSCINTMPYNNQVVWMQSQFLYFTQKSGKPIEKPFIVSAPKEIRFYDEMICIPANNGVHVYVRTPGLMPNSDLIESEDFQSEINEVLAGMKPVKELKIFRRSKKARTAIYDAANNILWGGFNDGVYYHLNGKTIELLINGNRIYANKFAQSANGMIWIAASNGIYGVNNTTIEYFYPSSNSLRTVFADGNTIWFSSTDALYRLYFETNEIEIFTSTDGISSFEIHDIITDSAFVYLATPEGLIHLPKNIKLKNKIEPLIKITHVKFLERDTVISNQYEVEYDRNHIAIAFTGNALKSQGTYTVSYRMLGISNQWITIPGSTHIIRFPSLSPGDYVFEIKCLNEDLIESTENQKIQFKIHKPYWQTWWFRLAVILIISYITFLLFKQRIKTINRKNQLEKQLKVSEITAIKAQMNPHFIFNSLNSIQDLILRKDLRSSNMYLGKFSDLLRLILEVSGKESINLETELEILHIYLELEKLRFEDEFNFHIDISGLNVHPTAINLPSMIIQPYVENAVKHGLLHKHGKKNLSIQFSSNENTLICTIEDDGIGRTRAEEIKKRRNKIYQPFGNSATQKRIELINALGEQKILLKIEDLYQEDVPVGTRVNLHFSIHL